MWVRKKYDLFIFEDSLKLGLHTYIKQKIPNFEYTKNQMFCKDQNIRSHPTRPPKILKPHASHSLKL